MITPFAGEEIDFEGLEQLIEFQIQGGIDGILAVGTTGESPTLDWEEHLKTVEAIATRTKDRCVCIAGTGSNNTHEALEATAHAVKAGVGAVLLVDPYYNGPSSLEIRREYVAPVAEQFPELDIIPYVIPGRTGCQLLPEDLALLYRQYPNVHSVKEATADPDNMRRTRTCCGEDFLILSGDDGMTFDMMTDETINAGGVISVVSNVAPGAVTAMVRRLQEGDLAAAKKILSDIEPLFDLVTVKTTESTPAGEVVCRARNPLGIKTLMTLLGMPSGGCRRPLGKMTKSGLDRVIDIARTVHANNPEILGPAGDFFNVDIAARLNDPTLLKGLYYEEY